jgi:hypothetical protein
MRSNLLDNNRGVLYWKGVAAGGPQGRQGCVTMSCLTIGGLRRLLDFVNQLLFEGCHRIPALSSDGRMTPVDVPRAGPIFFCQSLYGSLHPNHVRVRLSRCHKLAGRTIGNAPKRGEAHVLMILCDDTTYRMHGDIKSPRFTVCLCQANLAPCPTRVPLLASRRTPMTAFSSACQCQDTKDAQSSSLAKTMLAAMPMRRL